MEYDRQVGTGEGDIRRTVLALQHRTTISGARLQLLRTFALDVLEAGVAHYVPPQKKTRKL